MRLPERKTVIVDPGRAFWRLLSDLQDSGKFFASKASGALKRLWAVADGHGRSGCHQPSHRDEHGCSP